MALALKLTYFAIERMAEPVSEVLERQAANSPRFRSACMRLATWHSQIDYRRSVRRLAQEQRLSELGPSDLHPDPGRAHWIPADDLEPPPELTEKEATQRGAELLGEGFVLSIGLALLLHQAASDRADEAEQQLTIEKNEERIADLESQVHALHERVSVAELQLRRREPEPGKPNARIDAPIDEHNPASPRPSTTRKLLAAIGLS